MSDVLHVPNLEGKKKKKKKKKNPTKPHTHRNQTTNTPPLPSQQMHALHVIWNKLANKTCRIIKEYPHMYNQNEEAALASLKFTV